MCYISYDGNYYKPGANLSRLFQDLVVKPSANPDLLTQAWMQLVRNTGDKYHRKNILEQGRTNFDEPFEGLAPKEKVLLYCFYYMPMHLFSSYHIFTNYLTPMSNKVVFIDFGCGPLTSGVAFWAAFAKDCDLTYLGIDSSDSMLDMAQKINQYGSSSGEPFFEKVRLMRRSDNLLDCLDDYITKGDQTQIIFNFCYFLASKTLDALKIAELSNCLNQIAANYDQHEMRLVYQNPYRSPDGHHNWITLKGKLSALFESQITENTERFRCELYQLRSGRITSNSIPTTVYFDLISNKVNATFRKPFESLSYLMENPPLRRYRT